MDTVKVTLSKLNSSEETVMDYTVQTVSPEALLTGYTAIDSNASFIKGTYDYGNPKLTGQIIDGTITSINGDLPLDAIGILDKTVKNVYNVDATKIQPYAFSECFSLRTLNLPNVSYVPDNLFSAYISTFELYSYSLLEDVRMEKASSIGCYAFYGCASLKTAIFPKAKNIGSHAFHPCANLKNTSFTSVESVDFQAFGYCSELKTIELPNVVSISGSAFVGCNKLASVYFPELVHLDSWVFSACSSLENVKLPKVSFIGRWAFFQCYSLQDLYLGGYTVLENENALMGNYGPIYPSGSWVWSMYGPHEDADYVWLTATPDYSAQTGVSITVEPPYGGWYWSENGSWLSTISSFPFDSLPAFYAIQEYYGHDSWVVRPDGMRFYAHALYGDFVKTYGWVTNGNISGFVDANMPYELRQTNVASQLWDLKIHISGDYNEFMNDPVWYSFSSRFV